MFGLPVKSRQTGGVNLGVGDAFVGIYQAQSDGEPHINHLCFGLPNFDPERTVAALSDAGVPGESGVRDGVPQVYCADRERPTRATSGCKLLRRTGPARQSVRLSYKHSHACSLCWRNALVCVVASIALGAVS